MLSVTSTGPRITIAAAASAAAAATAVAGSNIGATSPSRLKKLE